MSASLKPLLRAAVVVLGGALLLGALLLGWWLVRPLGWVYALATAGALASLLVGAGLSARGSAFGRWLMED
jgi:hypothetical protein